MYSVLLTMECYIFLTASCLLLPVVSGEVYSNLWAVHIPRGDRVARSVAEQTGFTYVNKIMDDHYHFKHHQVERRSTVISAHHTKLSLHPKVHWAAQQEIKSRKKRDLIVFSDEKYRQQWYLQEQKGSISMNVPGAWRKGFTGKGVVVTILDDGIEHSHPDLSDNYDADASFDINNHDSDPMPRYDFTNENRHGTRCAGEVAAAANNSVCGVGVAYEASIGGIKMLDGDVTDSVEAMSLSLNRDHIDIYSASWGPDDDGKTVDGPATLARKAFRDGVIKGRNGKGSIFVWASGNGGSYYDNCNCDGYTNSIYTLSVSSATEKGHVPWYSEACSSTLVSTFSSGDHDERQITTTDLRRGCTSLHTGTSASAPLAAGIVALTLQANPSLSWRDVQYIAVLGASPIGLNADDWTTNSFGRPVSHHFGFGMMNAEKMVQLASNWTNIPEQHICEVASPDKLVMINPKETQVLKLETLGCQGSNKEVRYVENVQAKITLSSSWRGDLQIWLTSPSGTRSNLLTSRVHDDSRMGFNEWEFLTTHNWGEESRGEWLLEISNGYRAGKRAKLISWSLVLYGTETDPLRPQAAPTAPPTTQAVEITSKAHIFKAQPFIPTVPTKPATQFGADIVDHIPQLLAEHNDDDKWLEEKTTTRTIVEDKQQNEPCPLDKYYMRDMCVDKCLSGFYPATRGRLSRQCLPCHNACAECKGAYDYSCTECYFEFQLQDGQCIPFENEVIVGAAKTNQKQKVMQMVDVKSIVYGGISTVCVLVIVLLALIIYYKHQQQRNKECKVVTTLIAYKPKIPTDILTGSQHSSQQELMDSDGEISSQGRTSQTSIECRYNALPQHDIHIQPV